MIQKDILRRLLAGFCVLQFFVLLLWLTRYSYRVKELLVCWLLFCSFFAALALLFLGAMLACYAGLYLVRWASVSTTIIPELAACLAELPREAISGPRILVAGTLALSAAPSITVKALDTQPCLLIEKLLSTENSVPK